MLFFWETFGFDCVNAGDCANALANREAIAGENRDHTDIEFTQTIDHAFGVWSDFIFETDCAEVFAVLDDMNT